MDSIMDEEFYPRPLSLNGRYENPWTFAKGILRPSALQVFKGFYQDKHKPDIPCEKELDSVEEMEVLQINKEKITRPSSDVIQTTWLGHASFLLQIAGSNILFDPVFSDRIGPMTYLNRYLGMKRYRKCPISVSDLPDINYVIISHDHYDHLDVPTIVELDGKFDSTLNWCVPSGTKKWLTDLIGDKKNIHEMSWWEEKIFNTSGGEMKIACTPAQHWCKRSMFDDNQRLWASWVVVSSNGGSIFHSGDTGYCDVFKSIGKRYGPFRLSMIAIGAYTPNDVLSYQHVTPMEAVQIHEDIRSEQSIGMHWGTFKLTNEYYLEPPQLLKETLKKKCLKQNEFITMKHGETKIFGINDITGINDNTGIK